jgi:hypothetical protein
MKNKQEILDDYSGYTEEEKDKKIIIELLFDIRELLKPIEPSKPSEKYGTPFRVMDRLIDQAESKQSEELPIFKKCIDEWKKVPANAYEAEIRADERVMVTKQIEEFAHKEMKDGNWAYEKLLILLKTFYI